MPQVSKQYIKQERVNKIIKLFIEFLAEINSKKDAEIIFKEVLTKTEQIMIAKRISAYYLIAKGIKPDEIAEALKLSTSTIFYYQWQFNNSEQLKIYFSKKILKTEISKQIKSIFIELFYGTPRKGVNWRQQKRQYYQEKEKLEEVL